MVLAGTAPGPDGTTVQHEIRWSPLDDGRVRQHWRTTSDGGTTWTDAFVGTYRRQ
jgi:hypothetical protein